MEHYRAVRTKKYGKKEEVDHDQLDNLTASVQQVAKSVAEVAKGIESISTELEEMNKIQGDA